MIAASAKIHPLSVVEDGAVIGENVVVGPFCHVGPKVVLKDGVELLTHAVVTGRTVIGRGTRIFANAVIGGDPQSVHHDGAETTLSVGDMCVIREGVTMNTGTTEGGGQTVIGDNNLFLANSHVAHDCRLANHIILSNNVMLAGHVVVEDRVILGGGCAVHQFTRIGRQAFVGGLSAVSYDVIPYGMLNGNPGILGGLNVVGMSRSGMEKAAIHEVRRAFKQIFEGEGSIRANAAAIRDAYADSVPVMHILDFIAADSDRALSSPNRGKGLTAMADGRPDARGRLAIIAGGGLLPRYVADAARARGENPYILALTDESGQDWSGFDHQVISIGNYAGIGAAFRKHGVGRAVLSGSVRRRPEWRDIRAPFKALSAIPSVVRTLLKGGDDAVLKMVIRLIESEGVRVVGVQDIVPDLLGSEGPLGTVSPDAAAEADIAGAASAALALGRLDVGQGAVAVGGRVVALEGAEGTDAMLERVAGLRAAGRISARRKGVLVKLCKPEQDLRADLPSIGVETLRRAQAAGLSGIAVEAGRSLVLEREALVAEANAHGLFVTGIVPERTR